MSGPNHGLNWYFKSHALSKSTVPARILYSRPSNNGEVVSNVFERKKLQTYWYRIVLTANCEYNRSFHVLYKCVMTSEIITWWTIWGLSRLFHPIDIIVYNCIARMQKAIVQRRNWINSFRWTMDFTDILLQSFHLQFIGSRCSKGEYYIYNILFSTPAFNFFYTSL